MALLEVALTLWTLAAALWWTFALRLVGRRCSRVRRTRPRGGRSLRLQQQPRLTIFKPCPPLRAGASEISPSLVCALESFLAQLDPRHDELLLGLHARDRAAWEPHVRRWRECHPEPCWRAVYRDGAAVGERHANPKIAWQRELAPRPSGALWMWSDADIVAPSGFLRAARAEHRRRGVGAGVLTHPYVIRRAPHPAGLLDALFVNVELLPGVLLLGRRPDADPHLGLGASLLFSADAFRRRVDWDELGASLADDYVLARKLPHTRLGRATVLETVTEQRSWLGAALHYLRWQKTVRWCRPGGFAAQLLIFPLLGWLALFCAYGGLEALLGAVATGGMEIFFARGICRRAGCAVSVRQHWPALLGWSLLRAFGWLACWLPWPVRWNGRSWWRPTASVRGDETPATAATPGEA